MKTGYKDLASSLDIIAKKSMIKGRQKSKGNRYEIKISRILSQWYSPGTKDDLFWRTAGSGAKATVTRRGETSFCGDITYLPNPDALKVWIDCKDRKDITFDTLLRSNCLILKWYNDEWVKQVALVKLEKPMLIIFKLPHQATDYVLFKRSDFPSLLLYSMENMVHPYTLEHLLILY